VDRPQRTDSSIEKEHMVLHDTFLRHLSNAQAFFSVHNYKDSYKEIRLAGDIDPLNPKLARLAMEIFKRTNKSDGLIHICERLLEQDKDDNDIRLNLAYGFLIAGNFGAALDICSQLLELDLNETQLITAHEIAGDCDRRKNNHETAKVHYLAILDSVDSPQRILLKLMGCYYKLNDSKNVVVTAGRLIEMGYTDKKLMDLYNQAVDATKQKINIKYKPRSIWQRLFRSGYDPVYAQMMSLEIEKSNAERRLDVEKRKNYTDTLTQINNRTFFDDILAPMFDGKNEICLVMFDIDKFKDINDTHGHKTGDQVLCEFSAIGKKIFVQNLNGSSRQTFCRYGGEEFLAVISGSKTEASKKAETMRFYVESALKGEMKTKYGVETGLITCSCGLAAHPAEAKTFQDVYLIADKRLYTAKEQGRNKVIIEN
jgi:diguanylate cyclase (GGDEF)-like protein